LLCRLCIIKAALDDLFGLTRGALDAVWPAQLADRLIALTIIEQIRDIDWHAWTPVRVVERDGVSLHDPQFHDPGIQYEREQIYAALHIYSVHTQRPIPFVARIRLLVTVAERKFSDRYAWSSIFNAPPARPRLSSTRLQRAMGGTFDGACSLPTEASAEAELRRAQ
jgi:hypothetical protein